MTDAPMLRLVLPLPPGDNPLYRPVKQHPRDRYDRAGGVVPGHEYTGRALTLEYEAYRKEVWAMVHEKGLPDGWPGESTHIAVYVWVTWPDKRTRDLANIAKALGDSLKDALAVDDSRFYPWFLDIRTAGVPGTCEVLLLPMPMKGGIREEDHQPVPA